MAGRVELEELGQMIMAASVKAEFLGLSSVVSALDIAFSDIVKFAMEERQQRVEAAVEEELLLSGEAVGGS